MLPRGAVALGVSLFFGCRCSDEGALTIPFISGELTTAEQVHQALLPAWQNLVENRNNAGLVEAKQEGKPQLPMSKEETAFQYKRVQQGQVDSARLLLVFGMVPSTSYIDKQTASMFMEEREGTDEVAAAAEKGDADPSQLPALLDPSLRYADGSTPVHMAASFGLPESIRTLVKARADINAVANTGVQPIHAAAIMGHAEVVGLLSELGANVDARHGFAQSTPLHFAAEMGHPDVVQRLCELGADVEAEKKHGGTAMHISADTNNSAVTQALIDAPCEADPDAVLLGDTVPLYLAAGRGFHQVIDVLLEAGAKVDRTLWPSRPAPKKKRRQKKKEKKDIPISTDVQVAGNPAHHIAGSDPNAPGWEEGNGATALHNAAENGHLRAVLALLDGGALQLATMQGITPLISSLQYKHPAIARALLDHRTKTNVDVVNPGDGQTALHLAAAYDYPEIVARILREGGSTRVRDRRGKTALDYARGKLTAFLLQRFAGRDAKLDAIVQANAGKELAPLLKEARNAPDDAKETYVKMAQLHDEGKLVPAVGVITNKLRDKDTDSKSVEGLAIQFAIGRFMLAGSDAALAVEAMIKKTKPSMEAGLVLLGVHVESLEYIPKKRLTINGHDAMEAVLHTVKAAHRSAQVGNMDAFDDEVAKLRSIALGRPREVPDAEGIDVDAEQEGERWNEL